MVSMFGQDRETIGNHRLGRLIQAKLKVSNPDDGSEREADRVAEQVMRMPEPMAQVGDPPPALQRKCAPCAGGGAECPACTDEKESLARKSFTPQITPLVQRQANEPEKEEEENEEKLHTSNDSRVASTASPSVQSHIKAFTGGGASLPREVRSFFEPRFGRDLSDVRVHTGAQAAGAARSVNALAYTVGRDVIFGHGQYSPTTAEGQKLLAHELTHVVQQAGHGKMLQRFAVCEVPPACPARVSGEETRSRATPHQMADFPSPTFGILISNFAVDERQTKPDLPANPTWTSLITNMAGAANDDWEILGFSDCGGTDSRNAVLRQERADEIKSVIPPTQRAKVTAVTAAPATDCISSNATESGRSLNRAVLIRRVPGLPGAVTPGPIPPVGPVRPPGAPGNFCVPYAAGFLGTQQASANRLALENTWLPLVNRVFGPAVHDLWRDYLNRPKGSPLTPRVFRGAGNVIVDGFRTDPETVRHQLLLYAEIARAVGRTPEATIPRPGATYTSPPLELGTLLPQTSLIRTINYTDPHLRIPGNIAGGTGVIGTGSSDAGPDLRLFTGSVRIMRTGTSPGAPELKLAIINLQLQVIDAVDFCPGAPGGSWAQEFTIPMSRLEATATENAYDLPFHVFVDLSGSFPIP